MKANYVTKMEGVARERENTVKEVEYKKNKNGEEKKHYQSWRVEILKRS